MGFSYSPAPRAEVYCFLAEFYYIEIGLLLRFSVTK